MCVCIFREILVEESNVQRVDSPVTVLNVFYRLGSELKCLKRFSIIIFCLFSA